MQIVLGLFKQSGHEWTGYIIGAVVGVVLGLALGVVSGFFGWIRRWWRDSRPVHLVLQRIGDDAEPVLVFARDFQQPLLPDPATKTVKPVPLVVSEPLTGTVGQVPNIPSLWSRVEATAYGNLLFVLAQARKMRNVELVEMSKDAGKWNASIVVLGAQTERCFQFYEQMTGVAFSMTRDGKDIVDETTVPPSVVPRVGPYGYGIILKTRNRHRTQGGPGTAFLIGGFGVLGTEAAGYFFRTRINELARLFGNRTFGVIVRADANAGAETVQRLAEYDRATES